MADPILILACTIVTLAGVPGVLLYAGQSWLPLRIDLAISAATWSLTGIVAGLTGAFLGGFAFLVPALGFVAAAGVASALSERDGSLLLRRLSTAAFSLVIFLPLALLVFGWGGTWLYRDLGALDFAGAVPFAVGTGVFLAVHALAGTRGADGERALALRGAMLVAVAAIGCAVGLELRVDELTPAIALHMVMTPALAILAAAGIERVKRGRNTREGLATGTLAGTAAAMAASAYIETVSALILGLLAGAIAEAAFKGQSAAWRMAIPLLVGGVTGSLFLGIFGLDAGFVYSGQPVLLANQVRVVGASLLYAAIMSTVLFLAFRGKLRR